MGDKLVRLVTEIDTGQVSTASRKMEGDYRAAVAGMDAASRQAEASVGRVGGAIGNVPRLAARAGQAMSAAIGATTAAAAGAERSWIALGTSVLAAFGSGHVAGTIAVAGAAIGLLVGGTDKAAESARAAGAEIRKMGADAIAAGRDAAAALSDFGRLDSSRLKEQASLFRQMKEDADRLAGATRPGSGSDSLLDLRGKVVREMDAANAEGTSTGLVRAKALKDQADALAKVIELTKNLEAAERALRGSNPIAIAVQGLEAKRNTAEALRDQGFRDLRKLATGQGEAADASGALATNRANNAALLDQWNTRKGILSIELQEAQIREAFAGGLSNELSLLGEIATLDNQIRYLRGMTGEDARREVSSLEDQVAAKRKLLDTTREINVATANRSLDWEIAGAEALTAVDKRRVDLAHKLDDLKRSHASQDRIARFEAAALAQAQFNADEPVRRQLETMRAITGEQQRQVELAHAVEDMRRNGVSESLVQAFSLEKAKEPILATFREITGSITQTLSSGIVDGLESGFSNADEVIHTIWRSTLTTLLNDLLKMVADGLTSSFSSGLGGVFGSLFGGGGGGGGGFVSTLLSSVGGGDTAGAIASGAAGLGGCST